MGVYYLLMDDFIIGFDCFLLMLSCYYMYDVTQCPNKKKENATLCSIDHYRKDCYS